ncbi:MAG: hypothetical protein OXH96_04500 [Spirochaetaceae bacterium]|nr:hypothetical protein [Spirochaetaceae bacterium]
MDLAAASAIFTRYAHQFVVAYVFGSVAAGTADEHSDTVRGLLPPWRIAIMVSSWHDYRVPA